MEVKQMFSIQECVSKTETQLKNIREYMDSRGYFDPYECNLFVGVKRSVQREIMETFKTASLKEILDSTQYSTGALGAQGMHYLVPTYVSMKLYQAMSAVDIAPAVSADVPQNQTGDKIYINAIVNALAGRSGYGGFSTSGLKINNAEAKMERYTCPIAISNDMVEDNSYNIMQSCIDGAGRAMAKQSNDKICSVLKRTAGTTGYGTKTTEAAGADTTTPANVATCAAEVAAGEIGCGMFRPNLIVTSHEVWNDALITTAGHPEVMHPRTPMYDAWYGGYDVVLVNSSQMGGAVASNRLPDAVTIILEKELGIVTARNNWLRIENYSDPVKDLAGAVVSGRMGVGELVDSAIGVLTET
jgi:hypothetical protein